MSLFKHYSILRVALKKPWIRFFYVRLGIYVSGLPGFKNNVVRMFAVIRNMEYIGFKTGTSRAMNKSLYIHTLRNL